MVALMLAGTAIAVGAWRLHIDDQARAAAQGQGHVLFDGRGQLVGRLSGQTDVLPPIASRCANCHSDRSPAPAPSTPAGITAADASRNVAPFATRLNRDSLTTVRSRQSTPAFAYDAASMCALLRTGVSPAKIVASSLMPRYDIDDASCAALWAYLIAS